MTDQGQGPRRGEAISSSAESPSASRGPSATKWIIVFIAALAGVLVIGFVVALVLALTNPGAASGVQIVRDFLIIVLALEGILIGVALIVLVLQLARLTNLLQNEIKPILEETGDTVKTVRGTATFMSQNVADPVIRFSGFLAWLLAMLRQLLGVRRAIRRRGGTGEGD